jgi:membrane protein
MFGLGRHQDTPRRSDEPAENAGDSGDSSDSGAAPRSPGDLTKPSWTYVARKTAREFSDDQCTDLAAALTYYSVLALFEYPGQPHRFHGAAWRRMMQRTVRFFEGARALEG